jgi:hypothetical protein
MRIKLRENEKREKIETCGEGSFSEKKRAEGCLLKINCESGINQYFK